VGPKDPDAKNGKEKEDIVGVKKTPESSGV